MNVTLRHVEVAGIFCLVFAFSVWAFHAWQANQRIAEINADQIEACTYLNCHTTMLGRVQCRMAPVPDQTRLPPAVSTENLTGGGMSWANAR